MTMYSINHVVSKNMVHRFSASHDLPLSKSQKSCGHYVCPCLEKIEPETPLEKTSEPQKNTSFLFDNAQTTREATCAAFGLPEMHERSMHQRGPFLSGK